MKTMDEGKYDTNIKIAILTTLVRKKIVCQKGGNNKDIFLPKRINAK